MNILVTGGGGFLGGAIVRMLRERGHVVTVLSRGRYPELERAGIKSVQADIRDAAAVRAACAGMDAVIHTAAIAGIWGPKKLFWDINCHGTQNVLAACRDAGVQHLVYTSSPSVVFGTKELCGVAESQPYPAKYLAHYPASKAAAERAVLDANDATSEHLPRSNSQPNGISGARLPSQPNAAHKGRRYIQSGPPLKTVALRPHLIFGPGDPHLFPRIIARAKQQKLVQVGPGTNLVDVTYVDNAAAAHVLALENLTTSATCAGKAYFISQGAPVNLWSWLRDILSRLELPPPRGPISARTANLLGAAFEAVYGMLHINSEPRLTRFLAGQLATSHYFDISGARRDFGYAPRISTSEATDRLVDWLRSQPKAAL